MTCTIQLNDHGTTLKVKIVDCETGIAVSIDNATTKQIVLRNPNDEEITKTAEFSTDGTDGYIEYTTIEDDLNMLGTWYIQAFVQGPGFSNNSNIGSFVVVANLKPAPGI